ncbi:hypothetical protein [Flavobacterium johnsoniae]|uniref:Phage abortive infection protein n=1 Tax=Flavobacterium johnsoniae (strain ATCC 17061 / DSM 2064 / JCM 8514 / BCRC 14874 / CCUG 350202 / NBRC 14942 / NCIMB 11054 / UW101) TaxID=376686 RepID=A5FDX6_FLAJ1|nr:hypothetical protein [Flavobacterium johnsoniae]ABQ06591.1 hypothetical protein Fjoh_3577 [Flavobacterium johnsoniae UW101]OXE99825.1 hypothetical protein B0A63_11020 [Flavobacterium johnsoniae UW101]WQG82341.1 hypothetical protein SR927_04320 [Flavobacterium johnsoniae UW101]SHK80532.1 hypothetical protein SAMN05444146_2328 [Flavobacterium johnsoniae]
MKKYFKENILFIISLISLLLLLLPIMVFLYHFGGKRFSDDLALWGTFGDFIGGTLNTVISLSSLIILGLLTHIVSKQSNEESKKINLLIRKLDCYDKLTSFLPEITAIGTDLITSTDVIMNKDLKDDVRLEHLKSFRKLTLVFREFYHFILTFDSRFGHLFEYNMTSDDFQNLLYNTNKLNNFCDAVVARKLDTHIIIESGDELAVMIHYYNILIDNLKKELN